MPEDVAGIEATAAGIEATVAGIEATAAGRTSPSRPVSDIVARQDRLRRSP